MPPILPKKVTLRFPTRSCPWSPGSTDPATYAASSPTSTPGVYLGEEAYIDTALALYSGGSPSNAATLQSLADRFAADLLAWRQTQLDQVWSGVAAVQPTGLGEVEWDLSSTRHATRLATGPAIQPSRQLAHQVPDPDSACPDPSAPSSIATDTPCVRMYGPPVVSGNANASFKLDEYLLCLEDGRLTGKYVGQDAYTCGCGGGGGTTQVQLCYSDCSGANPIAGALFELIDGGTGLSLGTCTGGANGCCFIPIPDTITSCIVKVTDGGNTFSETISVALGPFQFFRTWVEVHGCYNLTAPGVPITITPRAGTSLTNTSLTTGSDGRAYWPYDNGAWSYSIAYPRFQPASGPGSSCSVLQLQAADGYYCACDTCPIPLCGTLHLTDSVIGSVDLVYTNGVWNGSIDYPFPAFCGCPGSPTRVDYSWPGGSCGQIAVTYYSGPVPTTICTAAGYIPDCPYAYSPTATPIQSISNASPPFSCAFPFVNTYSVNTCAPCTYCYAFGKKYPFGCGNVTTVWGGVDTATITIMDSCP